MMERGEAKVETVIREGTRTALRSSGVGTILQGTGFVNRTTNAVTGPNPIRYGLESFSG